MRMHLPPAPTCCRHILTFALATDVTFSHRLIHNPIFCEDVDKQHHEFKTPVGFDYDDWIGWAAELLCRFATEQGDPVNFLTVLVSAEGLHMGHHLLARTPHCRKRWKIQPNAEPPRN